MSEIDNTEPKIKTFVFFDLEATGSGTPDFEEDFKLKALTLAQQESLKGKTPIDTYWSYFNRLAVSANPEVYERHFNCWKNNHAKFEEEEWSPRIADIAFLAVSSKDLEKFITFFDGQKKKPEEKLKFVAIYIKKREKMLDDLKKKYITQEIYQKKKDAAEAEFKKKLQTMLSSHGKKTLQYTFPNDDDKNLTDFREALNNMLGDLLEEIPPHEIPPHDFESLMNFKKNSINMELTEDQLEGSFNNPMSEYRYYRGVRNKVMSEEQEWIKFEDAWNNEVTGFKTWLDKQEKPICLISHNGYFHDICVLYIELKRVNGSLPEDVYFADTLLGARNLKHKQIALEDLIKTIFEREQKHRALPDCIDTLQVVSYFGNDMLHFIKRTAVKLDFTSPPVIDAHQVDEWTKLKMLEVWNKTFNESQPSNRATQQGIPRGQTAPGDQVNDGLSELEARTRQIAIDDSSTASSSNASSSMARE